ncbi:hypothetical protein [Deinococcus radiotolerans]|uniref:IraD/Gp25-like domain-containing protein n=1 Tax=Deinococcus radiotolerans TaxID=1309407 RepID=A0ABQ2FQ53_9DEIO|nr:hypothetical protein [Deinococcus radiotolerans]GGL15958.1 hypothetical protein GCM10010844_38570 [Deinococcus radiotolerans]
MSYLGVDFSTRAGLTGELVAGRDLLVESLARRLRTRRGALFYDPEFGSYLPDYLGERVEDAGAEAAAICQLDLEEDPRVISAAVTVEQVALEGVQLRATLDTITGPISLIVDAVHAPDALPVVSEGVPYGVG